MRVYSILNAFILHNLYFLRYFAYLLLKLLTKPVICDILSEITFSVVLPLFCILMLCKGIIFCARVIYNLQRKLKFMRFTDFFIINRRQVKTCKDKTYCPNRNINRRLAARLFPPVMEI